MEIRQLQYFLAVAEQLSFSKAAAILYVTQPLLSQQIADLERQLGTDLFVRNRRSVSLTPAGSALYREASAIFRQMNQAVSNVRNAAGNVGEGGELSVGFEYIYPRIKLTDAIAEFRVDYPRADIRIARYGASQLLYLLNKGQIDLGFFTFPSNGFDSDCEFRILDSGWLSVAVSKCITQTLSLEEAKRLLSEYPVYLMDKDSRELNMVIQVSNALGVSPSLNFTDSLESILSCVECGMGTTIISKSILASYGSSHLLGIELKNIERARVCNVAVWKRGSGNALIPLLLDYIEHEAQMCDGNCGKSCSLSKK